MDVKPDAERRRVTLKDIAREVGVAVSTVSNAYNRPDQLSTDLRAKILDAAEALGYLGPDPAARSLRRGVTNTIGVVYPSRLSYAFTDPAAAQFLRGIALEVEGAGYSLQLVGGPAADGGGDRSVAPAVTVNVDGFIIHCFADGDPLLQSTLARALPTVMVDNLDVGGHPSVSVDDEGGARAAAEHLLALGPRTLGIASLHFDPDRAAGLVDDADRELARYRPTRARLRGYAEAVEAAGLSWLRDVAIFQCSGNTLDEGESAAASLLAIEPRPTAILAMSDQLALGVLRCCQRRGVRVPADLSVVGFDDVDGAAQVHPPLTTVHQPHVDKGRAAGRLLLAQLRGNGQPASVILPTRLAVRGSTAAAPEAAPLA